jgi:hypothetical protein
MTKHRRYMRQYYKKNRMKFVREERRRRKLYGKSINRRRRSLYVINKHKILNRNKRWRDRNSSKVLMQKRLQRLRQMGMDKKELKRAEQCFSNHSGKCQICGRKTPGGMGGWVGDYCHKTKTFRGILCNSCNALLGFAKDNIKTLLSAVKYLRRHK